MENETTGSGVTEELVTDIKRGYSIYDNVIPYEYLSQFQNYYNPHPKPKNHSKPQKSRKINRSK